MQILLMSCFNISKMEQTIKYEITDEYHIACRDGKELEAIQLIKDPNQKIEMTDKRCLSVLTIAVSYGRLKVIEYLIKEGADPNIVEDFGYISGEKYQRTVLLNHLIRKKLKDIFDIVLS